MNSSSPPKFSLNDQGEFIIENYNAAKNFSSFFPGIAGKMGVPMWVFYVNRGQCICSMGIQDKDKPIMEFLPANWAYQLASTQGFRTFLKFNGDPGQDFYEPFQDHYQDTSQAKTQRMLISPSHLVLEEINDTLGLKFTVNYHTVPEDRFAALVRTLTIENIGSKSRSFSGLDGLPLIIPYGLSNGALKHIRRLTEAFVEVINYDQMAPMFKGKVEPADRPEVVHIQAGNFYLGLEQGLAGLQLIKPVVDPQRIFGSHSDYGFPAGFLQHKGAEIYESQAFENRLPSAMSPFECHLDVADTYTLTSVIGHIGSKEILNNLIPTISSEAYLREKQNVNTKLINTLTAKNLVLSSEPKFDLYVRQNFLDNVLRGGYPYTLKGQRDQSVLHLYSRKHGDLERDYNDYRITPTPYSQGNGNYRDVNQNRRSDLLFNPDVGSGNLEHFFNLIQLDGFNPLVIKEIRYVCQDQEAVRKALGDYLNLDQIQVVVALLEKARTPGEILETLIQHKVDLKHKADAFLGDLLSVCHKLHDTDHGEGYWSDHWTYNLDLLENYLAIFPENLQEILFEKKTFTYHDSPYLVKPRADKYVIWDGNPMQLESVYFHKEKAARIQERKVEGNSVRTSYGAGEIYHTELVIKMLSIIANKIASLDPSGIGVEMETDKPNWYDALNGLPALRGSSLSETLEVKRNVLFLLKSLSMAPDTLESLTVFEELHTFIMALQPVLESNPDSFTYWDQATSAKEAFREKVVLGISGTEKQLSLKDTKAFLKSCLERLNAGIDLAWDADHAIPSTYFTHEVSEHEPLYLTDSDGQQTPKTNEKGQLCFKAKAFRLHHLPHFLEGPVHYLRCLPGRENALSLIQEIRNSDLYDTKLGMYKVNAPLHAEPMEIGRARVFSPGWFENESIWLHMEYKYMYEMLRNGLHEFFFDEFKRVFIPFQDPEVYGRSILENSSFLVSSANPNLNLHGTGYVARLSGATAEFIQILMHMAMGPKPFYLDDQGDLVFSLDPALPSWLFTTESQEVSSDQFEGTTPLSIPSNSFSFNLLDGTLVSYHNPTRGNTYGEKGVKPVSLTIIDTSGVSQDYSENRVTGDMAREIRSRGIKQILVELG